MTNVNAASQYLHWALISLHAETDPDCRKVVVEINLERRHSITSYVKKDAPPDEGDPKILLAAMEAVFTALTGPKKFNRQGCINLLRDYAKRFGAPLFNVPRGHECVVPKGDGDPQV